MSDKKWHEWKNQTRLNFVKGSKAIKLYGTLFGKLFHKIVCQSMVFNYIKQVTIQKYLNRFVHIS